MTLKNCDHADLKEWVDNADIRFTHSVIEVVRCPECQQTFRPTVDDYNSDVYLKATEDPRGIE